MQRQLFEQVPAHGVKRFAKLNMGLIRSQAKTFDCKVTAVVRD